MVEIMGHSSDPRQGVFEQRQHTVTDLQSAMSLMRRCNRDDVVEDMNVGYNQAIASRGDLGNGDFSLVEIQQGQDAGMVSLFGGTDSKVTDLLTIRGDKMQV